MFQLRNGIQKGLESRPEKNPECVALYILCISGQVINFTKPWQELNKAGPGMLLKYLNLYLRKKGHTTTTGKRVPPTQVGTQQWNTYHNAKCMGPQIKF